MRKGIMGNEILFKCPKCNWVGTEKKMDSDYDEMYTEKDGEQSWGSFNKCPKCGFDFGTYSPDEDYIYMN